MSTLLPATLKLDAETESRLLRLAETGHRSAHLLVREAIAQYLERAESREQLWHDALAAWTEYRATGRHLTEDEADAWLARLESGEDVEPPAPHN